MSTTRVPVAGPPGPRQRTAPPSHSTLRDVRSRPRCGRVAAVCLVAVLGCRAPRAGLPDSSSTAGELARAKLLTHVVASVEPMPQRAGMRDGATSVVVSPSGDRTTVVIMRFDPTAGDVDELFAGFQASARTRVKATRHGTLNLKPSATTVEFGDIADPVFSETPVFLWVRTHRDVALMLWARSERAGVAVLGEYAMAWGRL
ncbi:hypothetical protein ACOQFB_09730 [Anaeromyxobacter sp. Red801]|uniref:hypothetical protein n=1 Tax=Anaeromyxobacter sp. Red801 TaxID=3411632 RepID=UPI003BA0BB72